MEEPVISSELRTGRKICMDECPTDVFEMETDMGSHVADERNRIDRRLCEDDRPIDAVHPIAA